MIDILKQFDLTKLKPVPNLDEYGFIFIDNFYLLVDEEVYHVINIDESINNKYERSKFLLLNIAKKIQGGTCLGKYEAIMVNQKTKLRVLLNKEYFELFRRDLND